MPEIINHLLHKALIKCSSINKLLFDPHSSFYEFLAYPSLEGLPKFLYPNPEEDHKHLGNFISPSGTQLDHNLKMSLLIQHCPQSFEMDHLQASPAGNGPVREHEAYGNRPS